MNGTSASRIAAEGVGTAVLVGVGTGAVVLGASTGTLSPAPLAIAWFFAVAIPVLAFAGRSGAHLNPAVTAFLALTNRFPRRDVPGYLSGQVVGAFAGSAMVWLTLGDGAHLGAVLPSNGDLAAAFVGELLGSIALLATVLYLVTRRRPPRVVELLLPAVAVGGATYVFGLRSGLSLNPARTLAPAVLSASFEGFAVFFLTSFLAAGLMAALDRAGAFGSPRQPAIS